MELLEELLELERRFWTGGADFYREHLAPGFLMLFPGVGFMDRQEAIEGIAGGTRWSEVEIREARLLTLQPAAAIVAYAAGAVRDGDAVPYQALVASAYVRQGDAWLLAFHQQSPLPG